MLRPLMLVLVLSCLFFACKKGAVTPDRLLSNPPMALPNAAGLYWGTYTAGGSDPSGSGGSTTNPAVAVLAEVGQDSFVLEVYNDTSYANLSRVYDFDLTGNPMDSCHNYYHVKQAGSFPMIVSELRVIDCDSINASRTEIIGHGSSYYSFRGKRNG